MKNAAGSVVAAAAQQLGGAGASSGPQQHLALLELVTAREGDTVSCVQAEGVRGLS